MPTRVLTMTHGDRYVLYEDNVYEVEIDTGKLYKLKLYTTCNSNTWVEINKCTPITKEVADCMVACDPPTITFDSTNRYAEGWADPSVIYK